MPTITPTVFWIMFALSFMWIAIWFVIAALRYRKKPRLFPELDSVDVFFKEGGASGKSSKKKLMGASRVLEVVVTDHELWIRPQFPFNVLETIYHFDLEHRIPFAQIQDVEKVTRWGSETVNVQFIGKSGEQQSFSLSLKTPELFRQVIARQMAKAEVAKT